MVSIAAQLSRQIGPLRRAVLRGTRAAGGLPDLPEAQIEALRALADEEFMTPGELAGRLRLARSTVSNLIRSLLEAGLVERADGADLRTVRLSASGQARALLAGYDEVSERVLSRALAELDPADRRAITAAVPAIARLTAAVDLTATT